MKVLFVAAVFAFVCGLVSCGAEALGNHSVLYPLQDIPEGARKQIETRLTNLTDAIVHKWDVVHEILDGDSNGENFTESLDVDTDGCNKKLRNHFEERCDEEYEKVNDEAQQVEDERERTEAVCCALEDYEKCSLRAYDKAGCVTDKVAIKDNLKAARLFLTVIANITCNQFRGQCAYYNAAATGYAGYAIVFVTALVQLAVFNYV